MRVGFSKLSKHTVFCCLEPMFEKFEKELCGVAAMFGGEIFRFGKGRVANIRGELWFVFSHKRQAAMFRLAADEVFNTKDSG